MIPFDKATPISEYIHQHMEIIDKELQTSIPAQWEFPLALRDSMLYSLMAGGKRLRPILVMAAAESLGGRAEAAIPVACAVEMIHTYSLIHDDLPILDNDDYRRGQLTNHKVFGEAMALLAGDGLLTHAFYAIVQSHRSFGISAERILWIIEELALYAGVKGMVGGQAADLLGEQGITSISELEYIHTHKTSALIVFSLRAGGRIAGVSEIQLQALEQFGQHIGLAYQIQDDILDIVGDEQKLGKKTNSDEKLHKVTYPYFLGIDACREEVRRLTESGKDAIRQAQFPYEDRLLQLADYMMNRDH